MKRIRFVLELFEQMKVGKTLMICLMFDSFEYLIKLCFLMLNNLSVEHKSVSNFSAYLFNRRFVNLTPIEKFLVN